ncbi:uncharacterized protein Z519_10324 [Cladophialophora bantiana CBS 173.52]|uniref:Uncharacterized protein n=1 Tax=Cladophialophora bantiana (strain ATCC 10958 / CBS 173.52 / CDC B-1940 / NIH 8579) TaxID=1442370 RepID=A0A0D2HD80_CLAB1|nr:uncharacterized protein Z519_10324 [Cladophialophora bantiana CBS 173.52]KIW88840.1 hypothetical protein Z519_10324 [Cladophialophora bantiana CBS 173.52]
MNVSINSSEDIVSEAEVARWQRLFGYAKAEAVRRIQEDRSDHSRTRISDELWTTVRIRKEAEGYDRDTYEYSLKKVLGTFIVQLTGPLDSPEKIKDAVGSKEAPPITEDAGEYRQAHFWQIDVATRAKMLDWVAEHRGSFQPSIVRLTKARVSAHRAKLQLLHWI